MENRQTEIEQAKAILKQHGYFVGNLWHINDVKDRYKATDNEAHEILQESLTNESMMEHVWYAIQEFAEDHGLTELNND